MHALDLPDAFVESHHNKIKAVLIDGTHLVLERRYVSPSLIDGYHYNLSIKGPNQASYGEMTYTRFPPLDDDLWKLFQVRVLDKIWLPIEQMQEE